MMVKIKKKTSKKKIIKIAAARKLKPLKPAGKREVVLILDFGSQYTQLIARRVRENRVFSIIAPYNIKAQEIAAIAPKGLILSGGPASVYEKKSPLPDAGILKLGIPILGVCYGMQAITLMLGGKVKVAPRREYGKAELFIDDTSDLFYRLPGNITCWASHGDQAIRLPAGVRSIADTLNSNPSPTSS